MRITRLGHAAILVETDRTRILVDPGIFSNDWHGLTDLDGVIVTHQHTDHVDAGSLARLVGDTSQAKLLVEAAVVPMLEEHGLQAETARPGDTFSLGSMEVEVMGGRHALIHDKIPRIGNVGFVVSEGGGPRLYHPGDSYEYPVEGIDVLALPLTAPWAKAADTADYLEAVGPSQAFPIHDAILSERGRSLYLRLAGELAGEGVDLHPTGPTETLDL